MLRYMKSAGVFLAGSIVVFVVLFLLIQLGVINAYYAGIIELVCINIIMALSANLIINISGQLTLGHSAFMAIGAYSAAMISIKFASVAGAAAPFLFPVSLLLGGFIAALFGFLIGIPTLRLKGDYLAITTLGFCQIVVVVLQNIPQVGGPAGLTGIPNYTNFAWVFVVMIISIAVLYNIVHSNHGRAMMSVREDEIAAEAMGINTTRFKILSFTVGAFFAGIAGGLWAHLYMFIAPNSFDFMFSVYYVIYVVLGGTGNFVGCIASTSILTVLPEFLRRFGDLRMVIYPVLLIVIMILREKKINPVRLIRQLVSKKSTVKPAEGGKA